MFALLGFLQTDGCATGQDGGDVLPCSNGFQRSRGRVVLEGVVERSPLVESSQESAYQGAG